MKKISRIFIATVFYSAIPLIVYADIGVPMIFLTFPEMVLALVPIVFLEAWFYRRALEVDLKTALKPSFWSNLISTFFGIPIAWIAQLALEFSTTGGRALGMATWAEKLVSVTLQAGWLIPYESQLYWMIPAASIVGLVPAYFISVLLEYLIVKAYFPKERWPIVKKAVWCANGITYGILAVLSIIWLVTAVFSA